MSKGDVAIFLPLNYPHVSISLNTNLQVVAAEVHIKYLVTMQNIYLPPTKRIPSNELETLIDNWCYLLSLETSVSKILTKSALV